MKSFFASPYKKQGFTLIEVIVVISINTVLFLVIIASVVQIYQTNSYSFAQANEIDSARRGISVWVRDAREMTFAANGAFPLTVVEPHRLAFYSDVDRDDSVEYVVYELASSTLYKRTHKPTGLPPTYNLASPDTTMILSEFVQNIDQSQITFAYYNDSGALVTSPTAMIRDIRYIDMQIIVNIDPLRSPGEFMLQGSATPRNLKDNL